MNKETLAFISIGAFLIVAAVAWIISDRRASEIKTKISDTDEDLKKHYEEEKCRGRCRIKLTTERGHFYTDAFEPWIFIGSTFKIVKTSKEATKAALDCSMKKGYFTIIDAGVELHIPTCNVLSAEIVDSEPSV